MDWSKGYSASYYAAIVDPVSWRDVGRIEITGGSVKRAASGLLHSASMNCIDYPNDVEQWVRIYLDARQGSSSEHAALFTGLAVAPDGEIRAQVSSMTVQCYSVLKPAEDVALLRGYFVQSGARGTDVVEDLLSVCPAPIVISENSPTLADTIVAEENETRLSMAEKVMAAIGWQIKIDGNGTIYLMPFNTEPVATLDAIDYDVVEIPVKVKSDWFSLPNVFMATSGGLTAIARDENPESKLSIPTRGREIWMVDSECEYSETETLAEYSMRRLKEEQQKKVEASYDRRYIDGVYPLDVINIRYPAQGLNGKYIVSSQSISLGYNGRTSETVMEV